VLVFYDYHFGISDKEEDLMFTTKSRLFSIGTIVVFTLIWSDQPIELVFVLHVSNNIYVELIYVLHVKITIPTSTFKQLLEKISQPEVKEMEIEETHA
jgi:hypothetical protein